MNETARISESELQDLKNMTPPNKDYEQPEIIENEDFIEETNGEDVIEESAFSKEVQPLKRTLPANLTILPVFQKPVFPGIPTPLTFSGKRPSKRSRRPLKKQWLPGGGTGQRIGHAQASWNFIKQVRPFRSCGSHRWHCRLFKWLAKGLPVLPKKKESAVCAALHQMGSGLPL
ncbi:MAG: hypothetical protein R2788_04150 [Saprospiraceae bacterium]